MGAIDKKQTAMDANVIAARDEMMALMIEYAQEEIQGERGVIARKVSFVDGKVKRGGKIYDYGQDYAVPGQPPKNRTGNLRRSIRGVKYRVGFGTYGATVGPTIIYARQVELGGGINSRTGRPIWPNGVNFPYLKPAYEKFKIMVPGIIRKHLLRG